MTMKAVMAELDHTRSVFTGVQTPAGRKAEALLQDAALLAEEYGLTREEALQLVLRFLDGDGSCWPSAHRE